MAEITFVNIGKTYPGNVEAVKDFNLQIHDKDFVVFVGPSGCGKTTTLRMLAGLEEITDGDLYIDDKRVNNMQPKDRDIAMVFQNYALYPYMTVYENMSFGLRLKKVPKREIETTVNAAAKILGLEDLLQRKPKALSGGQRQRVALGRAIVRHPKVFLLDEPLSNLDAKMRSQMRTEIIKLHKELQATFVYVTHDQVEAMTMGTRIVVMKDGLIQQVDTPENLYEFPVNSFVAGFIGTPQINLIDVTMIERNKKKYIEFGNNSLELTPSIVDRLLVDDVNKKQFVMGIRPDDISLSDGQCDQSMTAEVKVIERLGNETLIYSSVKGVEGDVVIREEGRCPAKVDQKVSVMIDVDHIHLFDYDTSKSVLSR